MNRSLLASALSVIFGLAASQYAVAAPSPETFCVDGGSYIDPADAPGNAILEATLAGCSGVGSTAGRTGFQANNINGSYSERLIVSLAGGVGPGLVFGSTTVVDLNKFLFAGFDLETIALGAKTGLDSSYNLYAVVSAAGTISGTTFTATSATVNVFLDPTRDTVLGDNPFTAANDVFGAFPSLTFVGANQGDDVNLGSASMLQFASGTLGSSQANDGFAVQFGDFTPTANGTNFFIAPNPFYVVLFSDGDISNGLTVTSPVSLDLTGDANVIFAAVPEPSSVALVGLAMLGLGFAGRRSAKRG